MSIEIKTVAPSTSRKQTWKIASGFLSDEEAEALQKLATNKVVLEIGAFMGKSTVCMAATAISVLSIDTFDSDGNGQIQQNKEVPPILKNFLETTSGYTNISYVIGWSENVLPQLEDEKFDMVFIDGMHTEEFVRKDITLSFPKIKENGLFVFHDYWEYNPAGWPEVKKTVDTYFSIDLKNYVNSLVWVEKSKYKG